MDETIRSNLDETKHCPYCDEIIRANAIKCKHCGSDLTDNRVPTSEITPENQIKSALGSKYEIFEEIGRGGMATVYKAMQKNLNRPVALKVIHKNLVLHKDFLERFHREAQLSASLSHSNIVTIYDEGTASGVNYIAMEFLEGSDLHSYIQKKGKLTVEEAINIIAPIAEALDYAHSKGIVHRDIKSSNIIITNSGRAVLTDFGIAHAATETKLTQTGVVIGTPEYMSPEQAISGQVDAQSDLYSLGVVLYECITGDLPFRGDTPISTIYKIVNSKIEPISKTVPNTPRWLSSIVNKVLAKNKANRFKSGKEFSRALRARQEQVNTIQLSEEETIVITKENFRELEKKFHPNRRKKIMIISLALLFPALAAAGYFLVDKNSLPFIGSREANAGLSQLNEFERKRVELLLQEGDMLFNGGRLIDPPEKNAAEKFLEALKIQKGNDHAVDKLKQISSRLQADISLLIDENKKTEAKKLLLAARKYFPSENSFANTLSRLNVSEQEQKLSGLITKDPLEAYKISKQIQADDPANDYAARALEEIRIKLISSADNEFGKRNFNEALNQYSRIKTLFGSDAQMEQRIARSGSEVRKTHLISSADREFRKKNFKAALEQYSAIRSAYGSTRQIEERIAKCNSEIEAANKVTVPDLVGKDVQEAQTSLSELGLAKGKVSEILSEKNKGKVVTQIPKSGATVEKGTEVKLIVGK